MSDADADTASAETYDSMLRKHYDFVRDTDTKIEQIERLGVHVSEIAKLNMYRLLDGDMHVPWILLEAPNWSQDEEDYESMIQSNSNTFIWLRRRLEAAGMTLERVPIVDVFPLVSADAMKALEDKDLQAKVADLTFSITKNLIHTYRPPRVITMQCGSFHGPRSSTAIKGRGNFSDQLSRVLAGHSANRSIDSGEPLPSEHRDFDGHNIHMTLGMQPYSFRMYLKSGNVYSDPIDPDKDVMVRTFTIAYAPHLSDDGPRMPSIKDVYRVVKEGPLTQAVSDVKPDPDSVHVKPEPDLMEITADGYANAPSSSRPRGSRAGRINRLPSVDLTGDGESEQPSMQIKVEPGLQTSTATSSPTNTPIIISESVDSTNSTTMVPETPQSSILTQPMVPSSARSEPPPAPPPSRAQNASASVNIPSAPDTSAVQPANPFNPPLAAPVPPRTPEQSPKRRADSEMEDLRSTIKRARELVEDAERRLAQLEAQDLDGRANTGSRNSNGGYVNESGNGHGTINFRNIPNFGISIFGGDLAPSSSADTTSATISSTMTSGTGDDSSQGDIAGQATASTVNTVGAEDTLVPDPETPTRLRRGPRRNVIRGGHMGGASSV